MRIGKGVSPMRRRRLLLAAALVAPAFLIMVAVTAYPLLDSLYVSTVKWNLMKPQEGHPFIGFDNYVYILSDPNFWTSVKITLAFGLMAVLLEIVLGLLIALMLNRNFVGRPVIRMLALLPWAIPSVVNGIMWKWILNPRYGALNGFMLQLGLLHAPKDYIIWLGDTKLALVMVVLADVWKETPFIMLLFLAALQTIPADLYEAGRVDGAGSLNALFRITLPLIRPTLFVAVALRTIWALKSFDLIYTLTAGGPSGGTSVIGYYTYLQSFVSLNLGRGAAAAYLMTLVVMGLVIVYQRALYREVRY
ncbi:MAG TPA: sugar ABC transporter permease [Aggregatilineales bacterium]|nr:sugar ABC transporter permease [Aggregatilineales bacterium]